MIRYLHLLFLLLFVLPLYVSAQSSTEKLSDSQRIGKTFAVSEQLSQLTEDSQTEFSQNPLGLSPEVNDRLLKHFSEAFSEDSLQVDAFETIQSRMDSPEASAVLEWMDSETGQTLSETHEDFFSLQGIRKQVVAKYELEQDSPSDQRTALVDSLVEVTSTVDAAVESQAIVFRTYLMGYNEAEAAQSFNTSQLEGFINNYRNQIQEQTHQQVKDQLMLLFYEHDDEFLESVIDFYGSEEGQWLHETINEAMHVALENGSDRFLHSISSQ